MEVFNFRLPSNDGIRPNTSQYVNTYNCHNSGHYPSSYLCFKYDVSETEFCLHLQVEPTQSGSVVLVSVAGVRRLKVTRSVGPK
jgi:hypothetical protein